MGCRMKSIALHNLGCKVNAYEMEVMQQKFLESGYKIVPFDSPADIYLINTCTVTNIADRKSRQMLHRARRLNPGAVVVAVGCYVQSDPLRVQRDDGVDLAVGNDRKGDIVRIVEAFLKDRTLKSRVTDIAGVREYEPLCLTGTADHTRAYIKIQDGCNQFCSYCIIPYARGRVRSRSPQDVLQEVSALAKKGYREVVLTGIHLSSYGMDFDGDAGGAHLLKLIEEIAKVDGIGRIRLGSLEPRIITEEFAARLAAVPRVCPHFHLSLQSGCDETLRRMNRKYTTAEYYEKVSLLRRYFEDPAITTDVIVGFPGETQEEFEQTRAFLERVRFFEMHIFKYSRRKGTAADRLPGQLTEREKQERSAVLLALEKEQSRQYRESYIGKETELLLEEERQIDGDGYWLGHTKNYIKGAVRADRGMYANLLVTGKAVKLADEEILLIRPTE